MKPLIDFSFQCKVHTNNEKFFTTETRQLLNNGLEKMLSRLNKEISPVHEAVTVFSLVFRVTGKSVFWTGKAALLKIFFYPGVELSS